MGASSEEMVKFTARITVLYNQIDPFIQPDGSMNLCFLIASLLTRFAISKHFGDFLVLLISLMAIRDRFSMRCS